MKNEDLPYPPLRHMANSGGILQLPDSHLRHGTPRHSAVWRLSIWRSGADYCRATGTVLEITRSLF